MWTGDYTRRRTIYGYVNRFNLDPTLRVFDFPTPMQTQPKRDESIVAPQSLFTMNSRIVVDQAAAMTESKQFAASQSDVERIEQLFMAIYQRPPHSVEVTRITRFVEQQAKFFESPKSPVKSAWALVAQSLLMSNEFQYLD